MARFNATIATLAIAASLCSLSCKGTEGGTGSAGAAAKNTALDFSAQAGDGTTQTLASLTGEKALVVYFMKSNCGTNGDAIGYFKDIQKAYGDKVNFVGVINTDKSGLDEWQTSFNVEFPMLLDPDKKLIKQYGVDSSITIYAIASDQSVKFVQDGFSQSSLNELNAFMAEAAGQTMASLDFSGAPTSLTPG